MFKYGCTALATAGCLLVGVTSAHAAAGHDQVTGSGKVDEGGAFRTQLSLSAHSAADGTGPRGHAESRTLTGGTPLPTGNPDLDAALGMRSSFGGAVTCLRVSGNTAVVKYRFDRADPAALRGGGIEVFITDGGVGRNDTVGFLPPQDAATFQASDPSRCDPFVGSPLQVRTGNYKIIDR